MEEFGLVTASRTGHYDTDDLVILQTARELADYGLEPVRQRFDPLDRVDRRESLRQLLVDGDEADRGGDP